MKQKKIEEYTDIELAELLSNTYQIILREDQNLRIIGAEIEKRKQNKK